jgi:DNA-binding transcriptional ArsR family regulator
MKTGLHPTLWRTLRVLANPARLRVLDSLFRERSLSVSAVAARCRIRPVTATHHLRLLQSRGLIRARRTGRWVCYSVEPDPLVAHAATLVTALQHPLARQTHNRQTTIRACTAFTHERRLLIVRAIARGVDTREALSAVCHISAPALARHLRKLENRNVISRKDNRFHLLRPDGALAGCLLTLALA